MESACRSMRIFMNLLLKGRHPSRELKNLLLHAHVVIRNTAGFLSFCLVHSRFDSMGSKFSLRQKIKLVQPEVSKFYIKALEASSNPPQEKLVLFEDEADHSRIDTSLHKVSRSRSPSSTSGSISETERSFEDFVTHAVKHTTKLVLFEDEAEHLRIDTSLHKVSRSRSPSPISSPISETERNFRDAVTHAVKPSTKLVLFEDVAENLSEQLTNGSKKMHVFSIVGMPGIGKTTLADSVFEHSSITCHFHVRARCCVTVEYKKRKLMLEILKQTTNSTEDYIRMSDEDLEDKLRKSLKGRRYLIFMDDIWDMEPWKDMKASFPDDVNGSRIMFTSRFDNIASQAQSESTTYTLLPLSDDKSWELLQFNLFEKESCPPELEKAGQEIAKNCKGLPLTIDLIAGVLRETERKRGLWQQVAQNLKAQIVQDPQGRFRKVLELSYCNLPKYLRPCFLYFGVFPEDTEIPVKKLIWLWMAEGFVHLEKDDHRSSEDAAETYLNHLVSRSLITISKRESLGGLKASRIHDLLRDFTLAKAKEEGFLLQIDGHSDFSILSSDGYPWCEQSRLCIYPEYWSQFSNAPDASGPRVQSLLCSYRGKRAYNFSINLFSFRLLCVLDLQDVFIDILCPALLQLIHLRFLALDGCKPEMFSGIISHLQSLETFLLNGEGARGELFLKHIGRTVRLRHLHISHFDLICDNQEILEKTFGLDNLQTFSTPILRCGEDAEKIMRQMPNLRKLKCEFLDSIDYTTMQNRLPKLDFLEKLESLNVTRGYWQNCTCEYSFPPYLKKLSLSKFYQPWSEISVIGQLKHLEVLKLRDEAFEGKIWNMRDGEFPKLRFLSLDNLDIQEWNASEDHLPCLERLHVRRCEELQELPSCLAEIPTLQEIKLYSCSYSAMISAKKIWEEQEEIGNEQFVLKIDPQRLNTIRRSFFGL